jgi:hypothetical protein
MIMHGVGEQPTRTVAGTKDDEYMKAEQTNSVGTGSWVVSSVDNTAKDMAVLRLAEASAATSYIVQVLLDAYPVDQRADLVDNLFGSNLYRCYGARHQYAFTADEKATRVSGCMWDPEITYDDYTEAGGKGKRTTQGFSWSEFNKAPAEVVRNHPEHAAGVLNLAVMGMMIFLLHEAGPGVRPRFQVK